MASSSTSSVHKRFEYDVFLSFRGEDTRTNFVDHLYYALEKKSIHTYKDEKRMKKGKRIDDELIGSIENSKLYIIVFSKNYASSSWCLNELVKIMECHKTTQHTAYPIFYDVEPSEIRKQSGVVKEAFGKHEKDEAAVKWKETLKEAADLAGWELKNTADGHEARFIQKIVEEISLELRSINFSVDEKLVGMETRIKDFVSALGTGFDDDVRMIGIKGMGGGGKTTLARAVFEQISYQFEGKCFVENVREVSKSSLSGLKLLQNQVLSDVLNDQGITVSSVYDGKNMMKRRIHGRKVLVVVLDDVDHIDQLEALAGETNWFMPGSKVIITTRDEQVLVAHGVKLIHNVNLLSDKEAICLFHRYAFGRDIPITGYEKLLGQVVRYANGLPLTIRVMGSFLCGKNEYEWTDALERLKSIPLMETMKKLELSYIGLEEDYKEIFLDVACMLKDWPKALAIKALESCGFHARNGLRVLEQRSLITIYENYDNDEFVGMHDHIEEMGKNIVRRLHPDKPNKHSRLWIEEEVKDILMNDLGTGATKCVRFYRWGLNPEIVMKGLRRMKDLRFLDVYLGTFYASTSVWFHWNWKFSKASPYFPNALRYLRWRYYPFGYLPKTFQANNMVALEMPYSKIIQLWEGGERKVLNKLRFLDLSYSKLRTIDLGSIPNLETLTLAGCGALVELYMLVGCKLISVDLSCSKLRSLDLRSSPNLELLNLEKCWDLIELHLPAECLRLRSLKLKHSKLRNLDIGRTPNLECLDLNSCYDLEELHIADQCEKLSSLDISNSKLRKLDLGLTPNIKKLDLNECYHLVELHAPIGCLNRLFHLDLSGCLGFSSFSFRIKDNTFSTVDESLEGGRPLAELNLIVEESLKICPVHLDNDLLKFQFICSYKEDRSSLTGNIEKLISSGLCACTNLESLSRSICGLRRLRKLKLKGRIPEVPNDLDQLQCLEELSLLSTEIRHLPDNICLLRHLRSLKLKSCWVLEKLPEDIGRLQCLEKLTLKDTKIKHLPDSICILKHMKSLKLSHCVLLEKLPDELCRLGSLEKLSLSYTKIKHLPDRFCMLKHMKSLKLYHCVLLEKLPEDLDRLECLEKLSLSSTELKHLPDSISLLKHLKFLKFNRCSKVEKLPEYLGRLECLEKIIVMDCRFC